MNTVEEIKRRYRDGERDIVVDTATFEAYSASLIHNVRTGGPGVLVDPVRKLKFKDANVIEDPMM